MPPTRLRNHGCRVWGHERVSVENSRGRTEIAVLYSEECFLVNLGMNFIKIYFPSAN